MQIPLSVICHFHNNFIESLRIFHTTGTIIFCRYLFLDLILKCTRSCKCNCSEPNVLCICYIFCHAPDTVFFCHLRSFRERRIFLVTAQHNIKRQSLKCFPVRKLLLYAENSVCKFCRICPVNIMKYCFHRFSCINFSIFS